jgi:hypothetical protein
MLSRLASFSTDYTVPKDVWDTFIKPSIDLWSDERRMTVNLLIPEEWQMARATGTGITYEHGVHM